MGQLLDRINSPEDLRELTLPELNALCGEIRQKIIETVSQNGGHLASNLGVVELTVALHRVFQMPEDQIVWDVGHQAYTHKILCGRRDQIGTIRTQGGLSGYPNRSESRYDSFNVGHSSTSISAALGIAAAKKLKGDPGYVVAVIGDGALSGGLAYEGLNNAGRFNKNFIVILNDNKMSISRNVGSMARYLAKIRTEPGYQRAKGNVEHTLERIPLIGRPVRDGIRKGKAVLKQILYNSTIFEDLGFHYYGPFDGHDLPQLLEVLENTKSIPKPVLLHVITSKGKGYPFAERHPGTFHGVSGFDIETGQAPPSGKSFSDVFGETLCKLARSDPRICAITAAMQLGTGLTGFRQEFSNRFYDVGIAEEHAVTFAGGLSSQGMIPVFAVYSTFLQRAFDQVIHDAALQRLKVVLAVDRAGIVGEDGETHQGIFDVPFLNSVPGTVVYAPSFYEELETDLRRALYEDEGHVTVVRYPRGKQLFCPEGFSAGREAFSWYGDPAAKILIATYGRLFSFACQAAEKLREKGIAVRVLKLNRICPIDPQAVEAAAGAERIFFFEEGIETGGTGEIFRCLLDGAGFSGQYRLRGIRGFVKQASMMQSLAELGLDDAGMVNMIVSECGK